MVAYLDKNDIPGTNTFMPKESGFVVDEELFCSGTVKFFFQTVGIVVATTQKTAEAAAELIQLSYKEATKKPLLTVRQILAADAQDKIVKEQEIKAKTKGVN